MRFLGFIVTGAAIVVCIAVGIVVFPERHLGAVVFWVLAGLLLLWAAAHALERE